VGTCTLAASRTQKLLDEKEKKEKRIEKVSQADNDGMQQT
jgi:hypothetical protein